MEMATLKDLFVHEMKDLYSAEKQITEALPKMIQKARDPELKAALEDHLGTTEKQLGRVERILRSLDTRAGNKKCKGMEGILEEGKSVLAEAEPDALDAGIIGSAQKVEHYEIAAYGTAVAYARLLGEDEAARLLEQSLEEEKEADTKLTEIAESAVNIEAAA
jgi:ferritin-like metal-binding protein YciE